MEYRKWITLMKTPLFIMSLLVAGCAVEVQGEDENESSDFETREQAVSSVTLYGSGQNLRSVDFAATWGCVQFYPNVIPPVIWCATPGDGNVLGPKTAANYPNVGNLPENGIKRGGLRDRTPRSIAVTSPNQGVAGLYVLGEDNVVRYSQGRPGTESNWTSATGYFKNFAVNVKAQTTTGAAMCIDQIVAFDIPAHYAAHRLIALTCTGDIYYKSGDKWAALSANAPAPLNSIPRQKYQEISRGGKLGGYLLEAASTKRVFLVGAGTYDHVNYVPTYDNRWLPNLPNGLKPKHVGGAFVLTDSGDGTCAQNAASCPGDDKRVYRFDLTTNAWVLPSGKLVPKPNVGPYPTNWFAPWAGIVDGGGFGTSKERYFIWVNFGQLWQANP